LRIEGKKLIGPESRNQPSAINTNTNILQVNTNTAAPTYTMNSHLSRATGIHRATGIQTSKKTLHCNLEERKSGG